MRSVRLLENDKKTRDRGSMSTFRNCKELLGMSF